jgi:hypothetical protein
MLFVFVTVFACWLGYQAQWIVGRRAILSDPRVTVSGYVPAVAEKVPWIIRFFGEREIAAIAVPEEVHQRASRYFPEALVASPAPAPLDLTPYQNLQALTPYQNLQPNSLQVAPPSAP